MNKDFGELSRPPASVFPVNSLEEVGDTGPDNISPAQVTKTMFGRVEGEGRDVVRIDGITDETASSVGVESNHEEKCEVVSIPERFEALVANLVVGGGIHEDHHEEHEMASDATRLGIMDLQSDLLSDLSALDVDKVDVMGGSVYHGPESHGVSDLSVEPDVLISREEPLHLGSDNSNDVPQHREENETAIERKNETSTTRGPDGKLETVESGKLLVGKLGIPAVGEEEEMKTIKDDIEGEFPWDQEFAMKPAFTHGSV
jgi:hypothetical protein